MGVDKRAAGYAAAGGLLILIAGLADNSLAVLMCVLVNIVLLALYVTDFLVTPAAADLSCERSLDIKLSLSAENEVRITVWNRGSRAVSVRVHDDVPEHFIFEDVSRKKVKIPAKGYYVFTYKLTPLKRGEFRFPAVHVKLYGILGLCTKQRRFSTEDVSYKVYPNMKDLSRYNLASLSKNMFASGVKRVRTVSNGGEFNSLREYTQEDPYNLINWAATSRRNELIVNTYTPERNQYVYVMLDSSRVMNSEIERIKKLDYSINACFLLADYCIKGGDNIGLTVFDHLVERYVAAGKGEAQMDLLAQSLYNVESVETSANYDNAFLTFNAAVKRRSLVFVFTELFNADEAARFAASVKKYMGKHLVYTITINNPAHRALMERSENEDDIYVRASAIKFTEERRKISNVLRAAGIMNSDVDPDKLSLAVVSHYLDVKRSGIL